MPKQIIWSTLSESDFSGILEYLQQNWDSKVVNKFISIIDELIHQISLNPKQFPVIQKGKKVRK